MRVARVPANSAAAGRRLATPLHVCGRAMFLRRVGAIVRNDALERRVSTRLLPSVMTARVWAMDLYGMHFFSVP